MMGQKEHDRKMEDLQRRFRFGKMENVDEKGVGFNGRRLRMEKGRVLIDMEKFVSERMEEIVVSAERRKQADQPLTSEETSMARSVCGALNWAGKEGRPDASAAASMYSSKLKTMVVSDLLEINKVAKRLQENAGLTLQVQKLDRMKWGVVTDASWANTLGNKSQGGHVIITLHEELMQGKQAKTNVLIWKSGKLPRVVGSTLAETQSLARGVGEMIWAQVVYLEITEPGFNLHDWQHQVRERGCLPKAAKSCLMLPNAAKSCIVPFPKGCTL